MVNLRIRLHPCKSTASSYARNGAGRGSFQRNDSYRFAASLAIAVLKLLHVIQ